VSFHSFFVQLPFGTMAVTTAFIASIVAANMVGSSEAALRSTSAGESRINAGAVTSTLLSEIEGTLGATPVRRMARIEAALGSMYASLPKNQFGKLGHSTVRYALHRLFVQRHGWYVKGLEPAGDSWNTTSPAGILKDRVSSEVIHLMEGRLDGHGFSLHETAVLAATLEHLVHDEALERLGRAYTLQNLDQSENLNSASSHSVLDAYMKLYMLPEDMAAVATDEHMVAAYPVWRETQDFVRDVQKEVLRTEHGSGPSFTVMSNVVEEIGERFGRFQDAECRQMKDQLVSLGDHGIGRVALADFYRPALHDKSFQFAESMDYLRELGALDETDPSSPSVIVPNYVNAPANCIASSSFYSVCCLDECEQLMGHLESNIKAPEAPVATIVDLVSQLSSSTVEAPRTLPQSLLERLDEVAAPHAGNVQLHGRMFGQWMHHAFPRECPFPHVAGATAPRTPDEWMDSAEADSVNKAAKSAFASPEEMRQYVDKRAKSPSEVHPDGELNHWEVHEELLVPFPARATAKSRSVPWFLFSVVMLSAALISVASRVADPVKVAKAALESLRQPDEIAKIKAETAWSEPVRDASLMRLRTRGASYLPA